MNKVFIAALLLCLGISFSSYIRVTPSPELTKSLVFPVSGKRANVGSFWGDVRDGGKRKHRGIDIFARKGTPVVAISDGIIVSMGNGGRGGKTIWMQSINQPWTVYYAHLDQHKVKRGQIVKKGQVIGTVGKTGNARTTPPHLHFGIYTFLGAINPLPYIKNSPKVIVPQISKPKANSSTIKKVKKRS